MIYLLINLSVNFVAVQNIVLLNVLNIQIMNLECKGVCRQIFARGVQGLVTLKRIVGLFLNLNVLIVGVTSMSFPCVVKIP